jgi:ankyrin repeat protein
MLPGLAALLVASEDLRLIEAVRDRNSTAVRTLLQQRVDVNAPQPDGATALHWAAHWDDLEMASLLLRAGAQVNVANELGVTPIDLACENRSAAMVSRLLQAGADPKAAAPKRPPVLMSCARTGSVEGVKALLARGASVNQNEPRRGQTALMWAVAGRHAGVVQVLLEAGADVHVRSRVTPLMVNRADPNDTSSFVTGEVRRGGSTALLLAAREGDAESARLLLAGGANVNDSAPDGNSALVIAVHSNQAAVANLLLDRGADPNAIGAGYTALHAAVLRGNVDLVRKLLGHGALVDPQLKKGTPTTRTTREFFLPETFVGATPFLLAARFLEVDIMRVLAGSRADPRKKMRDGTTALMAAAGVPAQPPLYDRRGRVALRRIDSEALALDAVTMLVERGAQVNASNQRGDTALHGAAGQNYGSVAKFLVQQGARLDVRNKAGKTPLSAANGEVVATVLRDLGAKP